MIKNWFLAKSYCPNVFSIDLVKMDENGIRVLLCDIDNTLVAWHETYPTEQALEFLNQAKRIGIEVILTSNNTKERVGKFAEEAGCEYVSFFCKPFSYNYRKLLKRKKCKPSEVAVVGDQLLTDILGGNWMRLHTIFLDPLVDYDSSHTKFSRFNEKIILTLLQKLGVWKKGEYYGYKM